MKQFKTIIILAIFFSLTVRSFSQTPDRVLSAEEFRQQKIEEKQQQLKREIQVSENDRMRIFYDESVYLSKPYVKALVFLHKKYEMSEIIDAVKKDKNNEVKVIFRHTNEEINVLFFIEGRKIIDFLSDAPSSISPNTRYNKFNANFVRLVKIFNAFLAASPENREKVAQAIRGYRLAEYIKSELSDVQTEMNNSVGNYRFIGFTIGFVGNAYKFSNKSAYWDHSTYPTLFDFNFRYAYLYRKSDNLHIGFIIDVGMWTEFKGKFLFHPGIDVLFGIKFKRFLFGIGGYFYFISPFQKYTKINETVFKSTDIGLMISFNMLLGRRRNYLFGIDFRVNLNQRIIIRDINSGINLEEIGHITIFLKFGYGF